MTSSADHSDWDPSVNLGPDGYTERDILNLLIALADFEEEQEEKQVELSQAEVSYTSGEIRGLVGKVPGVTVSDVMGEHQEPDPPENDPVEHPAHYQTSSGLEAIDVIEAFFVDHYLLGNVFKYIARAGKKGNRLEDLRKAQWYLAREIDHEEQACGHRK